MPKRNTVLAGYSRILVPEEDGGFSAEMLELPGCVAQGATADEALKNLDEAANDWIRAMKEQGGSIPEPLTGHGFSGAVSLRLPRSLHRRSMQLAARDKTSQNQFLVSTIAARIGAEDLYQRLADQLSEEICERMLAKLSRGMQLHVRNETLNLVFVLGAAHTTAAQQATMSMPTGVGTAMPSGTSDNVLLATTTAVVGAVNG